MFFTFADGNWNIFIRWSFSISFFIVFIFVINILFVFFSDVFFTFLLKITLRHFFGYINFFAFFDYMTVYRIPILLFLNQVQIPWPDISEPHTSALFREFEWTMSYAEIMDWYDNQLNQMVKELYRRIQDFFCLEWCYYIYTPKIDIHSMGIHSMGAYYVYSGTGTPSTSTLIMLHNPLLWTPVFLYNTWKIYLASALSFGADSYYLLHSTFFCEDAEARLVELFARERLVSENVLEVCARRFLAYQHDQYMRLFKEGKVFSCYQVEGLPSTYVLKSKFSMTYHDAIEKFEARFRSIVDTERVNTKQIIWRGPYEKTYVYLRLKQDLFFKQYRFFLKKIAEHEMNICSTQAFLVIDNFFMEQNVPFNKQLRDEWLEKANFELARSEMRLGLTLTQFESFRPVYVEKVTAALSDDALKRRYLQTPYHFPGVFFDKLAVFHSLYWAPLVVFEVGFVFSILSLFWGG